VRRGKRGAKERKKYEGRSDKKVEGRIKKEEVRKHEPTPKAFGVVRPATPLPTHK
jgi:hypothetical protein